MNIENYIAALLYRYQCVTVPGFGAFLTETQSAKIIQNTNLFLPPKKIISFNAYLKNNDGLLANHVAQYEKISYEKAVEWIENQVSDWKKSLQTSKALELKKIGSFVLTSDANLVFNPNNQVNYLAQSFGLSSFVSPFIKRDLFKNDFKFEEKINQIEEEEEEENSSRFSFLKIAAVLVVGLGILGGVGYPLYENKISEQTLAAQINVQKEVQNKIQQATFFIDTPTFKATETTSEDGKMPYHVMAGSFRDETNAEKILQDLIAQGYPAKRLQTRNGLFPVAYGSYTNFIIADSIKIKVQQELNPDAWILIESL
jgi:CCDC81-like prokaryotic HU domain 2/CCDC81-like prokaryotic HU domain 1/SPOR domain